MGQKIFAGYQEYLAQKADRRLIHCKVAVHAASRGVVLPSDRTGRTRGGVEHSGFSWEIVKETPLDEYEKTIHERIRWERLKGSGRLDEDSIIFDTLLLIFTFGGSWALKSLSLVNFLAGIPSAQSSPDAVQGETQSLVFEMFWSAFVRKFGLLDQDWVIGLLNAASGQVIGSLQTDNAKPKTPAERTLEKIYRFRNAVEREQLKIRFDKMKLNLAKPGQPGAKAEGLGPRVGVRPPGHAR